MFTKFNNVFLLRLGCHEPRCKYCTKSPFSCESCKDGFITFKGDVNSTVQCLDRCPKGYKRIIADDGITCEKEPVKGMLFLDVLFVRCAVYEVCCLRGVLFL